ncbi:delta(14)-sterol reductase isoform X2 [Scleropages formosus]|uniref:delta(14)-sterol reductase isoform X2 n=1 Tax=Scleropages formosus TaxID=113540 RepID=UPI0010FACE31|nr:delta(14)-sterol reductase-like isoform X2 [Scleropages formosus]XP_018598133.2 delta(14)-sterol reductase-like isoform X2 [Scleropages formosus]
MENSVNPANGHSVHRTVKSKERAESESNGITASSQEVHETWNNAYLLLLCIFLPALLLLVLDGCRAPAEPWFFSGAGMAQLWDWGALQLVVLFTVLQGALYYLPFGKVAEGKVGHGGTCIKYSMNGLHALVVTVLLVAGLWHHGSFQGAAISSRVPQLVTASTAVALVLSIAVYLRSFTVLPQQLVNYGTKGNFLQEFALGREMDPSVGKVDLKQFMMVRIGFIGWTLVDISYLLAEIETKGWPTVPLLMVVTFHLVYILDFLIDEDTVLPTKEYTEDGIGFLMILGEYIWIPFYSSMPIYFLLHRPTQISPLSAVLICLMFAFGFVTYYMSNEQKSEFRKNPNNPSLAHLETIASPSGKKLLVSGWFGWVRHPNYLGDIMMTLAWCLPCGFTSFLPYLPALQCTNLLRLRAAEIEEACRKRHREAWQEYCRRVPYQLVPYVY